MPMPKKISRVMLLAHQRRIDAWHLPFVNGKSRRSSQDRSSNRFAQSAAAEISTRIDFGANNRAPASVRHTEVDKARLTVPGTRRA